MFVPYDTVVIHIAVAGPTSQPAQPVLAPHDPSVAAPVTAPAEAATAAHGFWKSLRAHKWWAAAAVGIYMVLFILGQTGVFVRIGTFWAWVLVFMLSLAAGTFAAFETKGFNWQTFFGYVTAGPTIAYIRDFCKDVLLAKIKERLKGPKAEDNTPIP